MCFFLSINHLARPGGGGGWRKLYYNAPYITTTI